MTPEWVAGRPVSLVQLAVRDHCVLLRLHTLRDKEIFTVSQGEWVGVV